MQGENLKTISTNYGLDVYQKTFHDLGATFEKNITKKFFVYAKASNLLNSKLEFHTKSDINVENISTSTSYLVGLKYNF